ncbi:glyoxalase/bleomycin resistance/extradiol dioxygenase family protein [Maribacter algarum]|uniref:Glyoxalase/bleomycin resistance/extradiol dioxygenase family protein n=1 Tax=Maribacter algarum (ex Zhang et al. 2020) TaxID=2578118 RepID=A0A5S3PXY2_9FLAO|nr:VOC family protein [Maribacter algarum]TMM59112.1 glyoxalase/bleomycin resistance/extradiol dioxygenase family protein [Maribacter algarum]
MRIEHIAIWVSDIENMRSFYEHYFDAQSGEKYVNDKKNFTSYFLSFKEGSRLELMHKPEILTSDRLEKEYLGLIHFAISVGSKERVNFLTEKLRKDGFRIVGEPRTTGDGYYESVVLDPEGNRIEITI